jgi:hypothetical protein
MAVVAQEEDEGNQNEGAQDGGDDSCVDIGGVFGAARTATAAARRGGYRLGLY